MMALWMGYALVLSLLFAAAARVGEKGLDLYGRPTRWVWIGAMAGAVLVPIAAHAAIGGWLSVLDPGGGGAAGGTATAAGGAAAVPLLPAAPGGGAGAPGLLDRLRLLDPWLIGGWGLASLVTALWLFTGWLQLRRCRRRWEVAEVDGVEVLISPDEGPAIAGFLRGRILLPSWFEELDGELRPLVLRHEREHLAVGDHRMLAGALAAVVLFPWNPVLWWSLIRLRQAMEIDCDRRVLGKGVSRTAYAELLVQIGERVSGPSLSAAAFAGSSSLLEKRIRRLASRGTARARLGKAAAAAATAVALAGAIGWVPVPDEAVEVSPLHGAETAEVPPAPHGDPSAAGGDRGAGVAPPAPAVMKLDLRLYRIEQPGSGSAAEGERPDRRELDLEAVRLAKRLGYACAPYMNGAAEADTPHRRGCFVVVDGEPVHPSVLRELGPGSLSSVEILPADEAVDRFGPDARRGAYVIRTAEG